MAQKRIGILVGSTRRNSYSQAVADAVSARLPDDFQVEMVPVCDLVLFSQDYDGDGTTPEAWKLFRQAVKDLDAFLFVTPEHNRSYPAALKNALDIASRPYGQNLWSGKPAAIISVSPGKLGGFGANHHLRQVLSFLNLYTMQQPEAYMGNIEAALDAKGKVADEGTLAFLQTVADEFVSWIARVSEAK